MVIVYGLYRWAPRQLAFRSDYCRTCEDRTVSVQVRTFNVFHIYWIPILPLGPWKRWRCVKCGNDPHAAAHARRGFKIVLAVIVALFNVAAWFAPQGTSSDLEMLVMRVVAFVLLVLAIGWVARHRPEPDFKPRLAAILPYSSWTCPLCGGQLVQAPTAVQCLTCKAEHRPLPHTS